MTNFYPEDAIEAGVRWGIIDAMRRYGASATAIGHAFASQHQLRPADLQALVAIMSAEGHGNPLTPGGLRAILGLSSAGTSYVIDRLVEAGHVERVRDHPADNRVVHLRYTASGQQTALAFFGPLGARTDAMMDAFSAAELQVIARFLEAAAESMEAHLDDLRAPPET